MPVIVLKVDVDTYRGTREGVPRLCALLQQHRAAASFLFSLGKDHTGWALKRVFRPGFFQKVSRTSVIEHYGIKTLLYGVLLPAPDIGSCVAEMRATQQAGFECGIHTWDHVLWQDAVRHRDPDWTRTQMRQAHARFIDIFGQAPLTHGAAGWQMNPAAYAMLDDWGMAYASDTRAALLDDGRLLEPDIGPHYLQLPSGRSRCLQLPTTLPTLDELLGREINGRALDLADIPDALLGLTAIPRDHVFTLHAELEGQKLLPVFDRLLHGWRAQGYDCVSMGDYFARVRHSAWPTLPLTWGRLPGRAGEWMLARSPSSPHA